jgi:hypothetical protein
MCTTLNTCTSLLANLPCYHLNGQRSSDKGVSLSRKMNDAVVGGLGHHHQLRARTREDGTGCPGEGRRVGPLPWHYNNIGPPGGRRQRATKLTKAEGGGFPPSLTLGPERRRGAPNSTGCLQPDSASLEMEVESARSSGHRI